MVVKSSNGLWYVETPKLIVTVKSLSSCSNLCFSISVRASMPDRDSANYRTVHPMDTKLHTPCIPDSDQCVPQRHSVQCFLPKLLSSARQTTKRWTSELLFAGVNLTSWWGLQLLLASWKPRFFLHRMRFFHYWSLSSYCTY